MTLDGILRVLRFAIVGSIGFMVDAGLTETLVALGINPYLARVFAVAVAIGVTYALNRRFTFKEPTEQASGPGQRLAYLAVSLGSIALNYAVYALAIALFSGLRPVIAVALGSGVGMFSNYFGYSRLVFRQTPAQAANRPASAP